MIARLLSTWRSHRAYGNFQRYFSRKEEEARARHMPVRPWQALKQERLHDALRGGKL
jgi:hypothetical protein